MVLTDAVLAVDLGGTSIKASVVDRDGTEAARVDHPAGAADGPERVLANLHAAVDETRAAATATHRVRALGVAVLGVVDSERGVAVYSANAGWRDLPLADLLRQRHGLPVAIDHDVRAAARAELRRGALRDVRNGLYVAVGTGIAAAVVVDGRVVPGEAGMAGELGHVPVFPGGEPCACGQRGCAETYASAASVARRYAERTGRAASAVSAPEVIAAAADGDPDAAAVWDDALVALTRALTAGVLLLDPARIVLGGGLSLAGDALTGPLADRLAAALAWRSAPPVAAGRFGADAGRLGAAELAWDAADAVTSAN